MKWLLYGVTGFTGKLILEKALEKGIKPVIAGRNPEKVKLLADKYQCAYAAFEVNEASEAIDKIPDLKLVLNCAGPFIETYKPMVEACIKHKLHYLDITGEIKVLEGVHSFHEKAIANKVTLLPAVGFDVVPTDCMALKLSKLIDSPDKLELAFAGMGSASRGTVKTSLYHIPGGNKIRKNGKVITVPFSNQYIEKEVNGRKVKLVSIPWGDVFTAYYTSGIPNIVVRTAYPTKMIKFLPLVNVFKPLFGFGPVKNFLAKMVDKKLPEGPSEKIRETARLYVFGKVENQAGETAELAWEMPEGYSLTATTAIEIIQKMLLNQYQSGFQTPAGLLGYEWFLNLEGVKEI